MFIWMNMPMSDKRYETTKETSEKSYHGHIAAERLVTLST